MAAVTQDARAERHIFGDCAVRFFTVTGASGSTLDTGMRQIKMVLVEPGSTITGFTESGGVLTLTSSAPMVAQNVMVISRVG